MIGLTGGLAAGKSTALEELRRLGAATASADEAARALSGPGGPLARAVRRLFGPGCLAADGSVDRAATARRVFADPAARRRLEAASHPAILREVERRLARSRRPVAVVDAPLLFEAGLEKRFDLTMTVSAPRAAALARARARGTMARAEALRRMRAQWPPARKERAADVVLANDGSKDDLRRKVRDYYRAFELLAGSSE
ncbi:MAG: dephospho-CoA kinase [Elusimicrobia bacterium]|nr:dephospho-CoA kinase [Elusimicrobiota bacterium]